MCNARLFRKQPRNRTSWALSLLTCALILQGTRWSPQSAFASQVCPPASATATGLASGTAAARLLIYIDLLARHAAAELEQAQADGDLSQIKALQDFQADVAATLELLEENPMQESDPDRLERTQEARKLMGERYMELRRARARNHARRVDNLETLGKVARGIQSGVNGAAVSVAGIATGGVGAAAMGSLLDGVSNAAEQYHEHGTVDPRQVAVHTASGALQGAVGGALSKPINQLATQFGARVAARVSSAAAAAPITTATDLGLSTGTNVMLAAAGNVGESAALAERALTPEEMIDITKSSIAGFASVEGILGATLTAAGRRTGLQVAKKTSPRPSRSDSTLGTPKPNPHRTRPDFDYDPRRLGELMSRATLPSGERLPERSALEASISDINKLRDRLEELQKTHETAWRIRAVTEEGRARGTDIKDAELAAARKAEITARTELRHAERDAYHINSVIREAADRIESAIQARMTMHSREKNPFPLSAEREAIESAAIKLEILSELLAARLRESRTDRARRWESFNYAKDRTPPQDRDTGMPSDNESGLSRFGAYLATSKPLGAERLFRTLRDRIPDFKSIHPEDQALIGQAAAIMTDTDGFNQFLGKILENPRIQSARGSSQYRNRILATLAEEARRYDFRQIKVLPKRGLDTGEFASFLARRELFLDPAFRNGAHGEDTHLVQAVYLLQNLRSNRERSRIFELMAQHPQLWSELFDAGSGTLNQPETLGRGLRTHIGLQ